MKIRKPDYYDRFQCIAGACSDSCCIGWEIDVDEERLAAYREVDGELGERLKTCMDWEEGHFILQGKEERCPFLNQENLCDLIIGLGEESLCEICREHPRFYEWYDDLTEVGVGLCCEAAARLVLEGDRPAQFVVHEDSDAKDSEELEDTEDADTLQVLFQARETAYAILQNRTKSIWERLSRFITYIEELQEGLDFGNLDEIEESAEYYRSDEWTEE
ncbi:MAG: flagellin lysine-N-methylase, partial [Lachnospiraceae bacterium]|nr:flagellin lysine-N-methylase [Lachnospiraceae bacterium]